MIYKHYEGGKAMIIKTRDLTIIEKNNHEYRVVIADTVAGWKKQVGQCSRCEQSCNDNAAWIRNLLSNKELQRYSVSVERI